MAPPPTMKALASLLLLLTLIILTTSEWSPISAAQASAVTPRFGPLSRILLPIDCPGSCNVRCSLAGVAKRCIRYCMICCNQCQCVPPGTVGNKEVCPCYASLKNSKGTSKCP